jgi:type IV pilus assembly protein PilA
MRSAQVFQIARFLARDLQQFRSSARHGIGNLALSECLPSDEEQENMRMNEKGFSLIELLVVVAIILIIASIAIPNLMRSKMATNEASAVSSLRTLNTASVTYSTNYGVYPAALASLGPMVGTSPSSATADLIDSVLAGGIKAGYTISYTPGASNGSYSITAAPTTPGVTGQRYFYTDQSGVIRADPTSPATSASSPLS